MAFFFTLRTGGNLILPVLPLGLVEKKTASLRSQTRPWKSPNRNTKRGTQACACYSASVSSVSEIFQVSSDDCFAAFMSCLGDSLSCLASTKRIIAKTSAIVRAVRNRPSALPTCAFANATANQCWRSFWSSALTPSSTSLIPHHIIKIIEPCGFNNKSNVKHFFKRPTGMTMQNWRNTHYVEDLSMRPPRSHLSRCRQGQESAMTYEL